MTTTSHPRHDIRKFRDIKPKLERDNWVTWKRELLAVARERGLLDTILGIDLPPTKPEDETIEPKTPADTPPFTQLNDEWNDRNTTSYNQILLCVSSEFQTAIDDTSVASVAWTILIKKFESHDPGKISIARRRYESYHMAEGESVTTYLNTMKEYKSQLEIMGEIVPLSYHTATILRHLPESWRVTANTIGMISRDLVEIAERLETHEANLKTIEDENPSHGTAFSAQLRNHTRVSQPLYQRGRGNYSAMQFSTPNFPRPTYTCNNCGRNGHSAARCFAAGGGLAGQAPWSQSHAQGNPIPSIYSNSNTTTRSVPLPRSTHNGTTVSTDQQTKNVVMMAVITEISNDLTPKVMLSTRTSAMVSMETDHYWLLDSAATSHLCGNIDLFEHMYNVSPITIETASGESFTATQRGTVHITVHSDASLNIPDLAITLLEVIYTPKLKANLLSVGRMTHSNVNVRFYRDYSQLLFDETVIAQGHKINNLFTYSALPTLTNKPEHAKSSVHIPDAILWHHRLAHTGYSTIEKMVRNKSALGFNPGVSFDNLPLCSNCPFGKQTRAPFTRSEDLPESIGDIITSDICGPFETSVNGFRYFLTWIDLKTRYSSLEFLKNKECYTVTESFRRFMAWISRQKNADVKKVRTDNGGEYMGKEFQQFCGELGIIHETTSPYTPEHNGVAERYNRTLQEGALTIRHESGLPTSFWVSATHTVNFVRNRILHSRIGISPYEAFWGTKPRLDWLRPYGTKCWALVPKAIRKKGEYRSVEGIFVGYYDSSKAYKIWIPKTRTILKARDAVFDESNHIERVTIHATDDDDLPDLWNDKIPITVASTSTPNPNITWDEQNELPFKPYDMEQSSDQESGDEGIERIARDEKRDVVEALETKKNLAIEQGETSLKPNAPFLDFEKGPWNNPNDASYGRGKRHQALFTEVAAFAHGYTNLEHTEHALVVLADDEPANYRESTRSPLAKKWREACEIEYETLMGYKTWTLVERPPNVNVVGSRWTFRIKRDNLGNTDRFKARFVAQGFSQVPGLDFNETYSPTIRLTSIRFILALACKYDLELRHIDVKGAYLNGRLDEEIFMKQPEGFVEEGKEHMVCKLHKGVYGLKQSGRVWHETLKRELERIGLKAGTADASVFFRFGEEGSAEIAGWYVDDGLLATTSIESMDRLINQIGGGFDIKNLGEPERLLGIKIDRNRDIGTIHISQPSFIDTIARRFDILPGRPIASPMDLAIELKTATDTEDIMDIPYASLIGSLNYCAIATRPDISYATNKCAQFTSHPTLIHWEAAKRIIRYLLNTREHGIMYRAEGRGVQGYAHQLAGFTDADYAGDVNDRKSTTGWIFTFNGAPISWASKKQGLVARSTMESELVAGSFATVEGIWLIRLGRDFRHDFTPIPIFTDNQSFIMFSNSDITNNRTKHIDVHFHYTQNEVIAGNVKLHFVPGTANPADILTKALSPRKHAYLLSLLGVIHA